MEPARSKAPAITHAAAILRLLAEQSRPMSLTAVARAVSVSPSSCLNFLRALVDEGLVSFDEETKTYSVGSAIISLARRAMDPDNTLRVARDVLRRLARDFDLTATLWRITHDHRLILMSVEMSDTDMRLHMSPGQRVPQLSGAVGRAVTAWLDTSPERLEAMFQRLRWEDPPTFSSYVKDLADVRERGWALDAGAFRRGVTSVASAVRDERGAPQLSVSTHLLGAHHDEAHLERVGQATVAAAARLRQMLYGVAE